MQTKSGFAGALIFAVALSAAQFAKGAQAFPYILNGGSVTFTHTADSANSGSPVTISSPISYLSIPSTPPSNFTGPSGFTNSFSTITNLGNSSTTAQGAIYQTTNATNMGVALSSGSGVIQTNVPGEAYTGASVLDANVILTWVLNSQFAPINSFPGINYQFPVGGVVGIGGTDEFVVKLNFFDIHGATTTPIGSLNIDKTYTNATNGPAAFSQLVSGNDALNGGAALPSGDSFEVTGDIKFRAKNAESPSTFNLSSDSSMSASSYVAEPTGAQDFTDTETDPVPEPSSLALGIIALGILTLTGRRRYAA